MRYHIGDSVDLIDITGEVRHSPCLVTRLDRAKMLYHIVFDDIDSKYSSAVGGWVMEKHIKPYAVNYNNVGKRTIYKK